MPFWRRLVTSLTPRRTFSTGPVDRMILEAAGRGLPLRVSRDEALSVSAVQRGRNMLCSIATLPLVQRGPDRSPVDNPLFTQLDSDVPNVVVLSQTIEDLLFEGISWWRVTQFGFDGYPTKVRHLDVATVSVQPPADGRSPTPLPSGVDPHDAVVWVDGKPVSAGDVIRFDSPNPGVLKAGARAVRRALLLDRAAALYAEDPRPLDYFSPAENADPISDEDVRVLLAQWRTARRERSTAYVPQSLKYNNVDTPSPADLQLVQLQQQAALDIANALGVDPEDLGVSTTSRTYANAVDRRRDRINDVLAPYMSAVTERLSMGDVTKRGYYVTFELDDYLKANPTERANVQKTYLEMGVLTVDEIRAMEGYGPRAPVEDDPAEAAAIDAARRALVALTGGPARFTMDLPVHQFAVDLTTRTIKGTVLPYGQYARTGGMEIRFAPGSLQFSDPSRIKLLRDHDPASAIGYATKVTETRAGVMAEFKVGRGVAGDEALVLAEDKVLDGFSVGVDFDASSDAVPDPKRKTAWLVNRADWRETSLTAMPAFDDARVTSVTASRDEGEPTVPETTEPTTAPAAPAAVPGAVTLTSEQFAAFLSRTTPETPAVQETRQVVNPTRLTASVTEPAPYRFDRKGNLMPGSHDFSRDLIQGYGRDDQAAKDRVMEFIRAQFDIVSSDVNELNPSRQRPDLYVDQRSYTSPVWDAINKGTLPDSTPFIFPKFSSAASLVGAHTEGQEPSSGTFVTTSETVTPTALSGKAKISREVWDAGGNPQVSNLIWRQMVKSWYEALEAAAVAALDAASPTQITLTTGGGTTGQTLAAELKAALAALHFVRGGFTMTDAFAQYNLYQHLVAAKDGNGRALFPAIGPSNADGTVSGRFQSVDVNGVSFIPTWSLAASGAVAASSYLFDRMSVHGWASAPQRLDITLTEVANVYIGIFGYKAVVISDINGVREIVYDPS